MKVPSILYTKASEQLQEEIEKELKIEDPDQTVANQILSEQCLEASNPKESAGP